MAGQKPPGSDGDHEIPQCNGRGPNSRFVKGHAPYLGSGPINLLARANGSDSRLPNRGISRDQFWLTGQQFSKIEPHLPSETRGKAPVDDRRIISGIVHVLKSEARAGSTRRSNMLP
jgi:hypothetical protein